MTDNENKESKKNNGTKPAKSEQVPVQVHSQYVKDMSFENPNSPDSILNNWGAPETHVQVNIQYRQLSEEKKLYEVVLLFRIEAKNKEKDKMAFIIELAYGCAVSLGNLPKDNVEPVLMIEIPKLLFPFAREIIANGSIQGGYPPLYIQPINFEAVYVQRLEQQKAEAEAGKDTKEKASV